MGGCEASQDGVWQSSHLHHGEVMSSQPTLETPRLILRPFVAADGPTVERLAGAHFTREALALKKNEQFMEFCERSGEKGTAELYREHIQPDEGWHVDIGHRFLTRYASSEQEQAKARRAVEAVLDLAVKVQRKQFEEMKLSHAPGC